MSKTKTKFHIGATGKIVKGHVLDVSRPSLERALRDYDAQLYLKWNPHKLQGMGLWEVRRKPETKTVGENDVVVYKGNTYVCPKYTELDIVNHVLDVPVLGYHILNRIKDMDTWSQSYRGKDFVSEMEYQEAKYAEREEDRAFDTLNYAIKQEKTAIRGFKDYLLGGGSPHRLAEYWNKSGR